MRAGVLLLNLAKTMRACILYVCGDGLLRGQPPVSASVSPSVSTGLVDDGHSYELFAKLPHETNLHTSPHNLRGFHRRCRRRRCCCCCLKTLARSVRPEFKQLINEQLKPLGFTGLKLDELTPNRTRRAQVGHFLGR